MASAVDLIKKAQKARSNGQRGPTELLCKQVLKLGLFGEPAQQAADILTKLLPDDPQAWHVLAIILQTNKDEVKSAKAFEKATQLDPKNSEIWNNLGNLLAKMGMILDAEKAYAQAYIFATSDKKTQITINYVQSLFLREKYDLIKSILTETQNDKAFDLLRARYYSEQKDYNQAIEIYQNVLTETPDRFTVWQNLAYAFEALGEIENALNAWENFVSILRSMGVDQKETPYTYLFFAGIDRLKLLRKDPNDEVLYRAPKNLDNNVLSQSDNQLLLTMSDATVFPDSWEIWDNTHLYQNMSFHVNMGDKYILSQPIKNMPWRSIKNPQDIITIEEPLIVLGGCNNYYHWLIDYLPRIELLKNTTHKVLVNSDFSNFQRASLDALGFDTNRLIIAQKNTAYNLKQAHLAHVMHRPMNDNGTPQWMAPTFDANILAWLRQAFAVHLKPLPSAPKRLFLSRANAQFRKCLNEDAVFELAQKHGFEKVKNEELSFVEQIQLYAGAEIVMGVHGAGFTNLVFAPQNCVAIELSLSKHLPDFYKKMAAVRGQTHIAIEGELVQALQPLGPSFWNFEVDLAKVEAVLKAL